MPICPVLPIEGIVSTCFKRPTRSSESFEIKLASIRIRLRANESVL